MFITFEGIDGSGKSTHVALLAEWLRSQQQAVQVLREPGATPLSEAIRSVLLDVGQQIDPIAELFLFCAARRQLVEEVIRPALRRGEIVLSDRFADSTVAYQGYGRGLDLSMVQQVIAYAIGDIVPNVTFILDVDVPTALARRGERFSTVTDRMEGASIAFLSVSAVGIVPLLSRSLSGLFCSMALHRSSSSRCASALKLPNGLVSVCAPGSPNFAQRP